MTIEPDPNGISWAERDDPDVVVETPPTLRTGDRMSAIDDLVAYAASLDSLIADPSTPWRAEYLSLIAPNETPARAAEMARMSGCALVLRGVLRRFILHPILEAPYRTGDAMADLAAIAREADAHRGAGATPQAGDIVIVGGGTDGGGSEHCWICIGEWGIDGGQVVDGYQAVTRREHRVVDGWDATATYRRRVRAVIRCGDVVARFGR